MKLHKNYCKHVRSSVERRTDGTKMYSLDKIAQIDWSWSFGQWCCVFDVVGRNSLLGLNKFPPLCFYKFFCTICFNIRTRK